MIYLLILLLTTFNVNSNFKAACNTQVIYEVEYLDESNDIVKNSKIAIESVVEFNLISSTNSSEFHELTHLHLVFHGKDKTLEKTFPLGDFISIESESLFLENYIYYDAEHGERYIITVNSDFRIIELKTHTISSNIGIKVTCND